MRLVIRLDMQVLSVVENVAIAPNSKSTVTTNEGCFDIEEVSFDYVFGEINCYTSEDNYSLF